MSIDLTPFADRRVYLCPKGHRQVGPYTMKAYDVVSGTVEAEVDICRVCYVLWHGEAFPTTEVKP